MIGPLLVRLARREDLTRDEAASLVECFVDERVTDAQIGATLVALAMKGETADELAGLAHALRERAIPVRTRHRVFLDTAGTGGDGSGTFNISTTAAFVIAAAGMPVAKHGNRAASSRSGSADVLAALGIPIDRDADDAGASLDELGICFMFAPKYHAATRRVADVRRQLGIRTAFNLLGPLTNPARAPRQVIGVGTASAVDRVAEVAALLGIERAWIVHGDGLDELSISGPTRIADVRDGAIVGYLELRPEDAGLEPGASGSCGGGSPEENAAVLVGILEGAIRDARRDIVVLNAAAGLVVGDVAESLEDGARRAEAAIDSGAAAAFSSHCATGIPDRESSEEVLSSVIVTRSLPLAVLIPRHRTVRIRSSRPPRDGA